MLVCNPSNCQSSLEEYIPEQIHLRVVYDTLARIMYLMLYLLLISGYVFSFGFFSVYGVILLLIFTVIFFAWVVGNKKLIPQDLFLTPVQLLFISSILSIVLYGGLYQTIKSLYYLSYLLLGINLLLIIKFSTPSAEKVKRKLFFFIIAIGLILRLLMIFSSPNPAIDVFDYLKKGAYAFMQGANPYSEVYTKFYASQVYAKFYADIEPNFYQYLPATLYFTLPSVLLFTDPRFTFVISEIGTAILLFKILKKSKQRYVYPLLILANPVSLYMIEESYTEPLLIFLLTLFALLVIKRKIGKASLVFGLLLGTKQYMVLVIPLFIKFFKELKQKVLFTLISLIVLVVLIAPFYFWSPNDFLHDTVFLQHLFPPRYEGLTLFSLIYNFWGIEYNFYLSLILWGIPFIILLRNKKTDLGSQLILSSVVLFMFFFFNKWAFLNYYYLVSQCFLLGVALKES